MLKGFGRTRRIVHIIVLISLLLPVGLFGSVPTATAGGTIVVNTLADDTTTNGNCTLREALLAASAFTNVDGCNATGFSGNVLITVPAGTMLSQGSLNLTGNVTIAGAGTDVTVIRLAEGNFGSVFANNGIATLTGMTISGGLVAEGNGGGINTWGTLALDAVRVTGNRADGMGGGININTGASVTITRSIIDNNQATLGGGGITSWSDGSTTTLNVSQSAILSNGAGPGGGTEPAVNTFGGGIYNYGNSVTTITATTISDNRAGDDGAGIYNFDGSIASTPNLVALISATISHNVALSDGGGIDNFGFIRLRDTIVAQNTAGASSLDCRSVNGPIESQGYNLIQNAQGCTISGDTGTNIYNQDPLLGPLRNNGGPTLTRALTSASPAIDAGTPGGATGTDQRGSQRPVNGRADIGAYEFGGIINDTWLTALRVDATVAPTVSQTLDLSGQSRWFKFKVTPSSKVMVQLTGLPANYDLTLYKDIATAFDEVSSTRDLLYIGAEFADDAFAPDTFSPDTFSPDTFSPDMFTADAFSPDTFSPDTFSPDTFSPDTFAPDTFSPDTFSPDTFSPDTISPEIYSSSQTRSLLAVSAYDGLASEGIRANTWLNDGDFYVRVRGRNGAFDAATSFQLQISLTPGSCAGTLTPRQPATAITGSYQTLILTDTGRFPAGPSRDTMMATLGTFAARPEINGVVVDLSNDANIRSLNTQADGAFDCPYAKNLVAAGIKSMIDTYRDTNPQLKYLVMVGSDNVIPFFRHPDQSLIGNERDYVPPVLDNTSSQASLRTGYYLSQDRYGATAEISLRSGTLPLPGLATGRLVETTEEITSQILLYLATNGVALQPRSSLVTGYDFLEDAANAVVAELQAGTGQAPETLITERDISPLDERSWTATQLRAALFSERHDLVYLAGHSSASSTLAADFRTRMLAAEVANSSVDLTNALVVSAGCHVGYNVVNEHAVPGVTQAPDWPQVFAQKGALLISGTGYQYGDTDFVEYTERLYRAFSQQLRAGSGGLAVGQVLVAAKQQYLAEVPSITGLHEKALLEATLYGLPMVQIDLPQGRTPPPSPPALTINAAPYATGPGAALQLQSADVSINTPPTQQQEILNPNTNPITATYLVGPQGIVTNPAQPVLPLSVNGVTVPDTVLRGVGFRGGSFTDLPGILPLTGAATTEIRGVKVPFYSDVFFPIMPYGVNYFNALADPAGQTRLMITPAQYRSSAPGEQTGTLRQFNNMDFRFFYSNNTTQAALAAAPMIVSVADFVAEGKLTVVVTTNGTPDTGVQEVWITFTGTGPFAGKWQPLDLTRDPLNPDSWRGTLDLQGVAPSDLRYLVQAAGGTGLVTMLTNQGGYYTPGGAATASIPVEQQATSLSIQTPTTNASAAYGTDVAVSARLLDSTNAPLANQTVALALGDQSRRVKTDANGVASASMRLLGLPDAYTVQATFSGTADFAPSSASRSFTVTKQGTRVALSGATVDYGGTATVEATLTDAQGNPLGLTTVFFTASGGRTGTEAVTTDFAGRATVSYPAVSAAFTVTMRFASGMENQPSDERYSSSSATTSIGMNRLALTVRADNATRPYGEANPPFTATPTGLVGGDTLASIGISCSSAATPTSPIGTYDIVCSGNPAGYNVTFIKGTLTIVRATTTATTTTAAAATATYGDASVVLSATVASQSGAALTGGTVTFTVKQGKQPLATVTSKPVVGTTPVTASATLTLGPTFSARNYTIVASYSGTSNFAPSVSENATLQVKRKILWLKPQDRTVGLRQPNPPGTPPANCAAGATGRVGCWLELLPGSNFAYGEAWSALNLANVRFAYNRSGSGPTNERVGAQYRITASGALSTNYDLRYEMGILTVVP